MLIKKYVRLVILHILTNQEAVKIRMKMAYDRERKLNYFRLAENHEFPVTLQIFGVFTIKMFIK